MTSRLREKDGAGKLGAKSSTVHQVRKGARMGVPDFQSLMLPLLRLAADGKEHSVSEARARLASEFRLSEGEQNELLPSGRQSWFGNRVAWAKVYLEQGGLLDSPS